jgi:anion-transporting  ArsA/GET3 family ATPase
MSKLVQKGGVVKTTMAAAIAVLLSRVGVRVHLVDNGPAGEPHDRLQTGRS